MKKTLFLLTFVAALAVAIVFTARAGSSTTFGSLTTVSNATSSSAVFQTNNATVAYGTFYNSHGALGSTNEQISYKECSLDGTNWFTVGLRYKPSTNVAGTDIIAPVNVTIPIYTRQSITASNSTTFGSFYVN